MKPRRQLTRQPHAELLPVLLMILFLASLNWTLVLLKSEEGDHPRAGDSLTIKEEATAQDGLPGVSTDNTDSSRKTAPEQLPVDSQPAAPPDKQDQSTAIHHFDSGVNKFYSGDRTGAIRDYSNAIAINPEFAMAYYNRGDAKRHLGDYEGAIQDFSLSLRLKPGYAEAWGNRGLAKTNLGNKHEGCQDLKRGAELGSKISTRLHDELCRN